MTLTHQEISCAVYAVNTTKDGHARRFAAIQLPLAGSVMTTFRTFIKDDKIAPGEYEVEMSTDEKKMIKDASYYFSLFGR